MTPRVAAADAMDEFLRRVTNEIHLSEAPTQSELISAGEQMARMLADTGLIKVAPDATDDDDAKSQVIFAKLPEWGTLQIVLRGRSNSGRYKAAAKAALNALHRYVIAQRESFRLASGADLAPLRFIDRGGGPRLAPESLVHLMTAIHGFAHLSETSQFLSDEAKAIADQFSTLESYVDQLDEQMSKGSDVSANARVVWGQTRAAIERYYSFSDSVVHHVTPEALRKAQGQELALLQHINISGRPYHLGASISTASASDDVLTITGLSLVPKGDWSLVRPRDRIGPVAIRRFARPLLEELQRMGWRRVAINFRRGTVGYTAKAGIHRQTIELRP